MDGPPPIHYVTTKDGVRLAYWTMGQGSPIVWLTETGFSHLSMEWDIPFLSGMFGPVAEQHQLIRIDLRNQGLSSRSVRDVSDEAFASDVLTVMDKLGIESASIASGTGRARTALFFAATHPERVRRLAMFGAWIESGGTSSLRPGDDCPVPIRAGRLAALFPVGSHGDPRVVRARGDGPRGRAVRGVHDP